MSSNEQLYEAALQAATDLFSDQSVTPEETVTNLKTLQGEIDMLLDTLPDVD